MLVATDCLSEGVNLQEHFQAVVHYDLAWNPTRHEQREGRVDRFGQQARIVRAVMLYGADNGIDGIVLDVLLRKHEQIRKALGISVPVPDRSDDVVQAILEGLLLRDAPGEQLAFEGIGLEKRTDLHREWDSAVAREHQSRTKYRQAGIQPAEVARELAEMRASLGTPGEVADFTREALPPCTPTSPRCRTDSAPRPARCPPACATRWSPATPSRCRSTATSPCRYRDAYLDRTDPNVAAIARYVLESALDPLAPAALRPARRCGVMRTAAVSRRTTLLLVRFRMHLELPGRDDRRQVVAEDAQVLAYRGRADSADWLTPDEVQVLLTARPAGNIPPDQAEDFAERAVADVAALRSRLDDEADTLADPPPRGPHPRPRGRRASAFGGRSPCTPRNPPTSSASTSTSPAEARHDRVQLAEDRRRPAPRGPARPDLRRRPAGTRNQPADLRPGARRVGAAPGLPVLALPARSLAGLQAAR